MCRVTDPWWKSLARILWWVFSRPWAVMMALGWPLLVAYGLMSPRAADLDALHLEPDEVALLVGIGGSTDAGQRSYAVLPRALTRASVTVVNDGTPPMVEEIKGALLILLTVWAVCVYLAWRYFWRPASTAWRKLDQRRA